jgi:CheY-like chemotaxis protein
MRIVILEDNEDRIAAMRASLAERFGTLGAEFHRSAAEMIEHLERSGLFDVALLSLDHDLEMLAQPDGTHVDSGTGVDVARWLSTQPALAPVIVHSTNRSGADRMLELLVESDWRCRQVVPYGNESWVRETWLPMVREIIVSDVPRPGLSAAGLQILKCHWRIGSGVDRILQEIIRAASFRIADKIDAPELSVLVHRLGAQGRFAPLFPGEGPLNELTAGALTELLECDSLEFGPRSIDRLSIDSGIRDELMRLHVRQMQVLVLRIPAEKPMQALLVCASHEDRLSLDSHRVQSTLAELASVLEVALGAELRRHSGQKTLTPRKRNR